MLSTVAIIAGITLASCTDNDSSRTTRYVALGDSAVAGAGIAPSGKEVCIRSTRNYPSLLAQEFEVDDFVDLSCPGATTTGVLKGEQHTTGARISAQIAAVTSDTDAVTISIGGNDQQAVPELFTSCYMPPHSSTAACRKAVRRMPQLLEETQPRLVEVFRAIEERAPQAVVVVVSYLRLMPDTGTCSTVPIGPADLEAAAAAEGQIETMMREAAEAADVEYVSMRERSEGHDACATGGEAWVNAITAPRGDGTFLHPNAQGMQAVADAVKPALTAKLKKDQRG